MRVDGLMDLVTDKTVYHVSKDLLETKPTVIKHCGLHFKPSDKSDLRKPWNQFGGEIGKADIVVDTKGIQYELPEEVTARERAEVQKKNYVPDAPESVDDDVADVDDGDEETVDDLLV